MRKNTGLALVIYDNIDLPPILLVVNRGWWCFPFCLGSQVHTSLFLLWASDKYTTCNSTKQESQCRPL